MGSGGGGAKGRGRSAGTEEPGCDSVSGQKTKRDARRMVGKIVVGRFGGYRGSKDVSYEGECVVVDCRVLEDP